MISKAAPSQEPDCSELLILPRLRTSKNKTTAPLSMRMVVKETGSINSLANALRHKRELAVKAEREAATRRVKRSMVKAEVPSLSPSPLMKTENPENY